MVNHFHAKKVEQIAANTVKTLKSLMKPARPATASSEKTKGNGGVSSAASVYYSSNDAASKKIGVSFEELYSYLQEHYRPYGGGTMAEAEELFDLFNKLSVPLKTKSKAANEAAGKSNHQIQSSSAVSISVFVSVSVSESESESNSNHFRPQKLN